MKITGFVVLPSGEKVRLKGSAKKIRKQVKALLKGKS